jgi:putative redox protein
MTKKAIVKWLNGYVLEGITDTGTKVYMDSAENKTYPSPAQLLLQALAGCTMMDCVLILTKSRKHLERFFIEIEATESETHSKIYTHIHLTYNFFGPDLDTSLIERAIKLSEEKYCRVHAMLGSRTTVTSSYRINNIS